MTALRYPLLAVAVEADSSNPFVNVYDLERRRIARWIDRWQQGQVTRTNGLVYDLQGCHLIATNIWAVLMRFLLFWALFKAGNAMRRETASTLKKCY